MSNSDELQANANIDISFIIPHMGREEMLIDTLSSISAQQFDLSCIEIWIVTKNKQLQDETFNAADTVQLNVIYADTNITISHQRNIGAKHAKGEFLAFLDADIGLADNWIQAMLEKLSSDKNIKLVSAIQKNSENAPPLERLRTALSNADVDCKVEFLPGRNLLLHKTTFAAVGGFPEHLETCEDYVFTQAVSEIGQLFYSADSHYVHIGEDKAFSQMAEKEVWRGLSNIASVKGRTVPLSEWPSFFAPPLFTFGIIFLCLLSIGGWFIFAAIAAIGAFSILALYSVRLSRIAKGDPTFATILKFYSIYFPARTWGTIKGLFQR
ncbi:glycosyltransferase [Agaribacter marinus]|uniref:Glycosyltransferase 2-like domain-containing protein n=1 Tax=Agaribacter marinus TaxID=1431249 RepID=A0AA37WIF1_9ALTE|nr:glycosyltransferase family A protein [Agaribacter marinus]GLR70923.1 hypothetical protein GCM10007852_18310 [Agaribacter marinus]